MIDTTSIRNKTLLSAMSGQLTEQMADDGTGENLLKRVQAKKKSLEKSGVLKKEKQMPDIPEEEKYLDIPSSWQWAYMGDIFQHNTGKALNASDNEGELLEYITTSNLYWDRFELDELRQMYFKPDEIEKCTVTKGDLLICEGGDIGRSAIWNFDFDMRIQNHIHKLRGILPEETCTEYFYYMMWLYKQKGWINGRGIGLQGFSSKRVHSLVIPLPPYQEQFRIAERVREIFEILDVIDELQNKYNNDVEVLKRKVIDAGIRGKLTEQLPEDGSAEDLYAQIQEEKEKLIKEGKLKKQKPLPEIEEDEIPFEIPKNWRWVRVEALGENVNNAFADGPFGSNLKKEHYSLEHQVRIIQLSNVGADGWKNENEKYTTYEHLKSIKRSEVEVGNIVIAKMMPAGRAIIVPNVHDSFVLSSDCVKIVPHRFINSKYLLYAINSEMFRKQVYKNVSGVGRVRTSLSKIKNYLLPLPSFNEQQRIANKLDMLIEYMK